MADHYANLEVKEEDQSPFQEENEKLTEIHEKKQNINNHNNP